MISILAMIIFILARAEVMLIIGEAIVLFIFSVVEILLAKKIMKRGIRKTILKMKEKEQIINPEQHHLRDRNCLLDPGPDPWSHRTHDQPVKGTSGSSVYLCDPGCILKPDSRYSR